MKEKLRVQYFTMYGQEKSNFWKAYGYTYQLSTEWKNLQLEPLGEKYSNLIEELAPKAMSSSFLKSTFGLTQTKKSISGRMKYKF